MEKHIILDVDGVILDCDSGLEEFRGEYFKLGDERPLAYTNNETFMEFNRSDGFSKLKPHFGAEIYIPKLIEEGYKISLITSCGDDEKIVENRHINLNNVFGDVFEDIFIIPLGGDKTPYLKKFPNGLIWVDDTPGNVQAGIDVGMFSVLMYSKFYHHVKDYLRVDNWKELYQLIKNHYEV